MSYIVCQCVMVSVLPCLIMCINVSHIAYHCVILCVCVTLSYLVYYCVSYSMDIPHTTRTYAHQSTNSHKRMLHTHYTHTTHTHAHIYHTKLIHYTTHKVHTRTHTNSVTHATHRLNTHYTLHTSIAIRSSSLT